MSNRTLWLGVSSLVAACPSLACCFFGLAAFTGGATYEAELGGASSAGTMSPAMGLVFLCLSLVPWFLPAGVWFYFRRQSSSPTLSGTSTPTTFTPQEGSPWMDD